MAPRTPDILDCASAQWIGKRREQEDVVKSLPAAGGMLGIVCDGMEGIFAEIAPPVWWRRNLPRYLRKAASRISRNV